MNYDSRMTRQFTKLPAQQTRLKATMKTDQVIALEIATLQALAELLPPQDACGLQDNSRQVVAAQIDVLAHRLDTNQVHDGYMSSCSDDMFLDVLHASDWLHDMLAPEYDSAPSIQWRDLVKYFDGAELVDQRAQGLLAGAEQNSFPLDTNK